MSVCTACAMGAHPHDTWGSNAPEVKRGERQVGDDAGCPRRACECRYVNPSAAKRPHPHCPTCRCGDAP